MYSCAPTANLFLRCWSAVINSILNVPMRTISGNSSYYVVNKWTKIFRHLRITLTPLLWDVPWSWRDGHLPTALPWVHSGGSLNAIARSASEEVGFFLLSSKYLPYLPCVRDQFAVQEKPLIVLLWSYSASARLRKRNLHSTPLTWGRANIW